MGKLLITGSAGYIGSRLWSKLFDEDPKRIELCDLKTGTDITSYEPGGPLDVIYHLAGQSGVITSQRDYINDARQNILGTLAAIKLANKHNARLVFTTSGAALDPESPYGLSKKTCEEYIKMLCDDYVILRLSSVYGEKPRGVVDTFIDLERCYVRGDGSAMRDFVHVDDIVDALLIARSWPKGIYKLGSGRGTSIKEIAEATGKEIVYVKAVPGEKHSVILENTAPYGWEPKINVLEYVSKRCRHSDNNV